VFSKQSYHVWRFLTFKSNYQCYSYNHDIVCSNDPILCKSVRLRMTNNVAEGSFYFFCTKNLFFIFWVTQVDVLLKELPKFNLKIRPKQSQKILEHLGFIIQHLIEQKTINRYFFNFLTTFCRFSRKRAQFELQVLHSLRMIFFNKIFLDAHVAILSEIYRKFRKIPPISTKELPCMKILEF
jgi:hypothetical protein